MNPKEFTIQRGITDNYPRKLILNQNEIKFDSKDLKNDSFITFQKDEIAEYHFGVNWMQYKFVFGREYVISIRNHDNQVMKINFKTYFGRRKNEYHKLCNEILDSLWDLYFKDIATNYINRQELGEEFKIGKVSFTKDGLNILSNASLKSKSEFIPWEKVRFKSYVTYFALYSKDDAININCGYSYLKDWNTNILHSVIKTILLRKKIEND
ncbi:hypothetical protein [Flavobacterium pectinovorum]|uniref:Uncharacterized protein n=1 Tax=Flavobacterium pectinovorum TaxID=29533 RepID=A0A502E3K9_9FLAO|nr:hypothetical protein [Flavobacterium pectinovorum]TPG32107.1 hypothetical protein EAH81_26105 [Flavobacterium pectinovorum]